MTAEEEAKQLDSVTDRVAETELDSSRANEALGALSKAKKSSDVKFITVKKDDVDAIVHELECSEGDATEALRRALEEDGGLEGEGLVTAALTRLVTS